MATITPLLLLRKPDSTELVNVITDLNENFDKIDALGSVLGGGAWTAYVPAWGATGAAPAIGNGVLLGSYQQVGKTVDVHIKLAPGTTTSYGTGSWNFTLPPGMVGKSGGPRYYPSGALINGGGFFLTMALVQDVNIFSVLSGVTGTGSLSNIGVGVPGTWSSGSLLDLNFRCEIA